MDAVRAVVRAVAGAVVRRGRSRAGTCATRVWRATRRRVKSLLLLLLVGAVVFLAYQNFEKQQALQRVANESAERESRRQASEMKEQVLKAEGAARAAADEVREIKQQLDTALAERDDARQQMVAANAEIARLTATTPKPLTWFEKRLENTRKLDAPPTATSTRRSFFYPAVPQPTPQP